MTIENNLITNDDGSLIIQNGTNYLEIESMKKFLIPLFLLSVFTLSAQQIVNLGDFIKPEMKDHTAAFKKAFSVKGVKQVNIPSGYYTLSDTIEICGKVVGSGEAKIHMTTELRLVGGLFRHFQMCMSIAL